MASGINKVNRRNSSGILRIIGNCHSRQRYYDTYARLIRFILVARSLLFCSLVLNACWRITIRLMRQDNDLYKKSLYALLWASSMHLC